MFVFAGPVEGQDALAEFLADRAEALPDDIRDALRAASRTRSPVEGSVRAVELIYARRDELGPLALDLGAGLAVMAASNGFANHHGQSLADDGRGARIAAALRREAGTVPDGLPRQDPALDPEPVPALLKVETPPDALDAQAQAVASAAT